MSPASRSPTPPTSMSPMPLEQSTSSTNILFSRPGTSDGQMASHDQLEELLVMFPSVPSDGVKFLFKTSNHNAVAVTDCLV